MPFGYTLLRTQERGSYSMDVTQSVVTRTPSRAVSPAAASGDPSATVRAGQSRSTCFPMTLATNPLRAAGSSKRARMRVRTAASTPALAAAVKVWE